MKSNFITVLILFLATMSNDVNQITSFAIIFLRRNSSRKTSLTEAEKLVISVILQGTTYKKASIQYQYTESSLQNAASGLFQDLSKAVGVPVNRRNFIELLEKERLAWQQANSKKEFVFDRLQANLWLQKGRAALISTSYSANQEIDFAGYLVNYSLAFGATLCLEVNRDSSGLALLWSLCNVLQAAPVPRNDRAGLLKSIGLALKQRSTLLVLRFDRAALSAKSASLVPEPQAIEQNNLSDYAEILTILALMEHGSCILALDSDPVSNDAEVKRSLAYQLRSMVDRVVEKLKLEAPRLIFIENDPKMVFSILQTYLQKKP